MERWLSSVIVSQADLGGGECSAQIRERIRPDDIDTAKDRLRAYIGGYPARLLEALSEAYPALLHVIGPRAFADLANRYSPHVPVGGYSLGDVGAALPAYLTDDELVRSLPFAVDLAQLEWAVLTAFHAEQQAPFDPAPLAEWTMDRWERARLSFQPAVAVIASDWPILDVWHARETPVEEIDIELDGRPQQVLVHRSDLQVVCESVSRVELDVLASLLAGTTLGETTERAASAHDVQADDVSTWFAGWMGRGLLVNCSAG